MGTYEYGDLLIAPGRSQPAARTGPRTWDYDDDYTVPSHVMRCHGMVVSSDYARHGHRCRVTSMHDFDAAAPLRKGSLFCACHGGAKRTHQWDDKQRKSRACSYVDPDDVDTLQALACALCAAEFRHRVR